MNTTSAPSVSLLLAGSLCLLPFLVPYHQQPVLSFFPEWLAVAVGVAAALAMLGGRNLPSASLPAPGRWLLAFAVFLLIQGTIDTPVYFQLPVLAALYVLYAVLMIWVGAQLLATLGLERVAMVLAGFLLAGALANSAAGIIQYYGRPALLEDVIAERPAHGAFGNIAQWNLYANYLALGVGALLFLWLRVRVRTAYALAGLIVLVWGSALSGSRGALLYALWYAALGLLAVRVQDPTDARRLRFSALGVAAAILTAHLAVPGLNRVLALGSPAEGTLDRVLLYLGEPARQEIALLALRVFGGAPIGGVGIGKFAGAAFELGLDPSLTQGGEIWTSPHNLPLHLLAETGAIGAILALGGLCVWGWRTARRYRADAEPALWWILAATGIELIHSFTGFPLWSAHFLGVAALLVGASSRFEMRSHAASLLSRLGVGATCVLFSATLGVMLRDYMRLDVTRITGTTITLARPEQAQRDAATMRELTHGLLAPVAERWILLGAPLDRDNLADKLAMSGRVARNWPASAIVVRHAVFLAFDGKAAEARAVLARAMRTFPQRREATILILQQAFSADPAAIGPLLTLARADAPA